MDKTDIVHALNQYVEKTEYCTENILENKQYRLIVVFFFLN